MSTAPKYSRLDPARRREQILDAANELFAERGYDEVSIEEIASSARRHQGALGSARPRLVQAGESGSRARSPVSCRALHAERAGPRQINGVVPSQAVHDAHVRFHRHDAAVLLVPFSPKFWMLPQSG